MPWCKCSTLTYCYWWSSPGILHCAVVSPHYDTLTHWWVNGEHSLVGTLNKINYSLGLLVGSIESYHNPIPPPGDSGSRSTSGSAGEGVCWDIESYTSYNRWTCMVKVYVSNASMMIKLQQVKANCPLVTNDFIAYFNLVVSGMCMHSLACIFWATFSPLCKKM